ncbi:hypothetical protein DICVIV_12307 [Dictyocaulus viviparus]|uniref:Uncharacterized protein n=1 Tax=Dictyocaulus viviparus TaxID=29172 RepID=A0A0D8XAX3_DICVI|nr:hypothetical protein DICVIV_12307 [Dictyocaulus viviparus]
MVVRLQRTYTRYAKRYVTVQRHTYSCTRIMREYSGAIKHEYNYIKKLVEVLEIVIVGERMVWRDCLKQSPHPGDKTDHGRAIL